MPNIYNSKALDFRIGGFLFVTINESDGMWFSTVSFRVVST